MSRLKDLKRGGVYRLTSGFFWLFERIPRRLTHFLAQWITLGAWWLIRKDQHRTDRHLGLVYGNTMSPKVAHNIGREFYLNMGRNFADMMRFRMHFDTEIQPTIEIDGWENLERAYARGRGVVGVTGHIGHYEMMAVCLARRGLKVAVVGRRLYESRLDRLLVETRSAMGLTNITTTDSPRRILTWLRDGGLVGVLIDTDSTRVRGEFLPFFGRASYTPLGQSILGLKTGAAFVPMACSRTEDNCYRATILPEVNIPEGLGPHARARVVTERCLAALEGLIEADLTQWIWLHNPWRTRFEKTA